MERQIDINAAIGRIPALNPVIMELLVSLQDNDSDVSDLKKIIESDANTSANILKIANSPFYGMSGRIKTVKDACVLLGYGKLNNVIYATALDSATNKGPFKESLEQLRLHTFATAVIAESLAKFQRLDTSYSYSGGLLHELGKQILMAEFPEEFQAYCTINTALDKKIAYQHYCNLGQQVAKAWKLPNILQQIIAFHNDPQASSEDYQAYAQVIMIASHIAACSGYPSPGEHDDLITPIEVRNISFASENEDAVENAIAKAIKHIQTSCSQ
jgi:putative nucleotidyltransferase with HDIG domain